MAVKIEKFQISTKGFSDVIDITSKIQNIILGFDINDAVLNISLNSSTASLLTLEQEPGLGEDLSKLFEEIIPLNKIYNHDLLWFEGNANAHLKAALLGNNITLAIKEKKIELGFYQKIVFVDFDNKPSTKTVIVSIIY